VRCTRVVNYYKKCYVDMLGNSEGDEIISVGVQNNRKESEIQK
jgi:hypothetical protein